MISLFFRVGIVFFSNFVMADQLEVKINDDVRAVVNYETERIETGPASKYGYALIAKSIVVTASINGKVPSRVHMSLERTTSYSYTADKEYLVSGKTFTSGSKILVFRGTPMAFQEEGYPGETKHSIVLRYISKGISKRIPIQFTKSDE